MNTPSGLILLGLFVPITPFGLAIIAVMYISLIAFKYYITKLVSRIAH